jgi:hypothetical protein
MTITLMAKKNGSNYDLYQKPMTVPFGRVIVVDGVHRFEGMHDDSFSQGVQAYITPENSKSLPSILTAIRLGIEAYDADCRSECEADMATERAHLQYLERTTNDDYGFEQWEAARGCF